MAHKKRTQETWCIHRMNSDIRESLKIKHSFWNMFSKFFCSKLTEVNVAWESRLPVFKALKIYKKLRKFNVFQFQTLKMTKKIARHQVSCGSRKIGHQSFPSKREVFFFAIRTELWALNDKISGGCHRPKKNTANLTSGCHIKGFIFPKHRPKVPCERLASKKITPLSTATVGSFIVVEVLMLVSGTRGTTD